MLCFLVTVSVTESKVMSCNKIRVKGNSKAEEYIAQPFHSLNAPMHVHGPMIVNKQTRLVA